MHPPCRARLHVTAVATAPSPIIVSAANKRDHRAREVRADGALGKPFDLDELPALVARYAG